ncbi:MAG: hypothetical protein Q8921_12090 [Bacteroidota bacterium]|nr:hypothetical protein [Bacteroidota bacterium]
MKRLNSAMRAAICVLATSTAVTVSKAQEKPWELSLAFSAYNTFYEEDFMSKIQPSEIASYPQDLRGNSFTALAFSPHITYRARQDLSLPFFLSLEGSIPSVTIKGLETGHKYEPNVAYLVQREDVQHDEVSGSLTLGWEMLPWIQPYLMIERSRFASRRLGQLDGTDSGTLVPEANQDYTEIVIATNIGFGIAGMVPLTMSNDIRMRYDVGYQVPQTVFVENDLFGTAPTGQGTTGYTIGGHVQLDLPFGPLQSNDGYWTIGGSIAKRHWNGDGEQHRPS